MRGIEEIQMADDTDDIDFLDEIIQERSAMNPDFPKMVEEAYRRRVGKHIQWELVDPNS